MNKKTRLLLGVTIIVVLLGCLGYIMLNSDPSQFDVSGALAAKEKMYLFNWDKIPGNDSLRLIDFLKQRFGVDWVKTANIEKIDNDKTIKVYTEKNLLFLKLNNEKTELHIEIDDGRTDEFIPKTENDGLNIYEKLIDKPITINGTIVPGTNKWDLATKTLTFKMTDGVATIDVVYIGDIPNMPAEAVSITAMVTGQFNNNVFQAFKMLTKCPSTYEGNNLVDPSKATSK